MVILFIIGCNGTFSQNSITEHIVKSGESLYIISKKYDVSIDDIKEFNGLTGDIIFINQIIEIPSKNDYTPTIDYNNFDINKRMCVRLVYNSQIGVREATGNNDGYYVEKYLQSAGLGKGYAWCAAFVNWSLMICGDTLDLKYPAWVPSYFPNTKLIYVRGEFKLRHPIFGDLIGIWFQNKNRLAHIGFYDGENDKFYFTIEGNTNNVGSREGDGVYRKKRIKRQVHSISSWIEK